MSKMKLLQESILVGSMKINILTNKSYNFIYEVLRTNTKLRRILFLETAVTAKMLMIPF